MAPRKQPQNNFLKLQEAVAATPPNVAAARVALIHLKEDFRASPNKKRDVAAAIGAQVTELIRQCDAQQLPTAEAVAAEFGSQAEMWNFMGGQEGPQEEATLIEANSLSGAKSPIGQF